MSRPEGAIAGRAMPCLSDDGPALSRFEFWPGWIFYAPVSVWVLCLMVRHRSIRVPLAANPGFPAGGFVGEEKSVLFAQLKGPERRRLPDYVAIRRDRTPIAAQWPQIVEQVEAAGLRFPLVAKPDIGCRGAGVRPIRSLEALRTYAAQFPEEASFLVQTMVEAEGEAGVFYVREPGAKQGKILSLTLKYFPHVVGDGRSTLRELILDDSRAGKVPHLYFRRLAHALDTIPAVGEAVRLVFSGSHSKGAIFRNGNSHITEAMRARFDAIADGIEGFHFGRFDVRFSDFDAFQRGEDFAIIEYNGAGAEMTHIWDSRTTLIEAWRALFGQFSLLFQTGAANRKRGARLEGWRAFWQKWRLEKALVKRYPVTG